ncbi:dephospho-CoA kinase [Planctomycetaceae bacterium]|nr:dephospho-CoA kinase [Planctomycetaceae bacterium]
MSNAHHATVRSLPVGRTTSKYLIGLTGNIATGKSTVARMLQDLGATVIDADALVHDLQRPGTPTYDAIVAAFGHGILDRAGEIDRKALGSIVFTDPDRLRVLESILHPAVAIESQRRIATAATHVIVYEAIKLIEAGRADMCDAIWVVTARPDVQLQRLMRYRQLSEAEARQRIDAQPLQSEKLKYATVVIDNSGELSETQHQVRAAFEAIEHG